MQKEVFNVLKIRNPILTARAIRDAFPSDNFLDEIIRHYGIIFEPSTFQNCFSGMLIISDSYPAIITVNKKHSPKRQRFTLAHEIGHFVLGHGSSMCNLSFSGSNKEIAANQFAAELLMPVKDIDKMVQNETNRTIMAGNFGVSRKAMDVRLKSLKLNNLVDSFVNF